MGAIDSQRTGACSRDTVWRMQAELHGKLSTDSALDLERREDLLTDYVFGALRYLDRSCLLAVLRVVLPDIAWSQDDADTAAFAFWPQLPGGTEPDVMITVGRQLVIFEAKLHSGFSVGESETEHQLVREWQYGQRWAVPRKLETPHVVAVTDAYSEPPEVAAANNVICDEFGAPDSRPVRWVSWQQIAQVIENSAPGISDLNQLLIADVLEVMERRGVRRVFSGFNQEDYWVVAAGTRIAADRIFPAVATFAQELYEQAAKVGLIKGVPESKIVTNRSDQLRNPHLWGVTHINVPFWVAEWPTRKRAMTALLFTQFSLTEPAVRVGYRIRINPNRKQQWHANTEGIVASLQAADVAHDVAELLYPDLGSIRQQIETRDLTAAWLSDVIDRAEKYLAVQRTIPLDGLTQTAVVLDMLRETRELIEAIRPLLAESEHA